MSTPMNPQGNQSAFAAPQGGSFGDNLKAGGRLQGQAPSQARLPRPLNDGGDKPIGFGRLFGVELRKVYDTRAGKVLIAVTLGLIALISVLVMWNEREHGVRFWDLLGAAMIPFAYLLPILGILTVTSEWSQRTGLNTFTLEPRRPRVIFAKWAAAAALTVAAVVASFLIAALFTAIGSLFSDTGAIWSEGVSAASVAKLLLLELLYVSMGIAFGLLIQNTPGAICAYLFIPMVISLLNLFEWARKPLEWVNPGQVFNALSMPEMPDNGWWKILVAALIWIVLPMALGFIRLNKRELKSA